MTLLLNVESGRELREGDEVRILEGQLSGKVGKVIGVQVLSESPVVVQTKHGVAGYSANEVSFLREGPARLEPLPPVVTLLQESAFSDSYRTCASMLCVRMNETSTVLTLVPTQHRKLKDVLASALRESPTFAGALEVVLESCFVTRLPHLVENSTSKTLDRLLAANASVDEVLSKL